MRSPGIEPGSITWQATIITTRPRARYLLLTIQDPPNKHSVININTGTSRDIQGHPGIVVHRDTQKWTEIYKIIRDTQGHPGTSRDIQGHSKEKKKKKVPGARIELATFGL